MAAALAAAVIATLDQAGIDRTAAEGFLVRHADALTTRVAAIENEVADRAGDAGGFDPHALLVVARDFVSSIRADLHERADSAGDRGFAGLGGEDSAVHGQDFGITRVLATADALFDNVGGHADFGAGSDSMAGLLALAGGMPHGGDVGAQTLAPQAVLAEVLGGNGVDHLLESFVGQDGGFNAGGDNGSFDLSAFLNQDISGSDAVILRQTITETLHEMVAAG
jgi:hypothetical protein